MMKFRYHRGSLKESLATTEDFSINNILHNMLIDASFKIIPTPDISKMEITYYGYDDRCNQDLFIIKAGYKNQENKFVVGFMWEQQDV